MSGYSQVGNKSLKQLNRDNAAQHGTHSGDAGGAPYKTVGELVRWLSNHNSGREVIYGRQRYDTNTLMRKLREEPDQEAEAKEMTYQG